MKDMLGQVEPLIPALRRYARALVHNRTAADALVEDCLRRAVSRWYQRGDGNVRAWLFTILHGLTIGQFRLDPSIAQIGQGAGRHCSIEHGSIEHGSIEKGNEDGFGEATTQDQSLICQMVLNKLAHLPIEQQAVLLLVGVEDLSYADTAKVLAVPVGTVMSWLSRTRVRLHQEVEGTAIDRQSNVVSIRSAKE